MALVVADRTQESTTTSGTGALNLAGAVAGYQSFISGIGSGNTTYYVIYDQTAQVWEIGIGTVTSGAPNTLSRDTVLANSLGTTAKINLPGNASSVWCDYPALKSVYRAADGSVNLPGAFSVTGSTTLATSLSGLLKATAGLVATATSGTDYAPATSGTSILKGSGTGGFSNAVSGTDYIAPGGALGTPSSGTLTNCTGLPVSTGVSGLGTNVATFLATPSSANLAAALTDETGTGAAVFANTPTLVTPILGTPTSGTLSNCTVDGTDSVGFRNIPQNAQTGSYTLVASDSGKHIYHAVAAAAATYTIPANSSVAYALGTAITFVNLSTNAVTIAITSDTLYLASAGTTGSRTLAQYGTATAIKITSTAWIISGAGLT